MERLRMGALLGVTQGAGEPPKLVVLEYAPKRYGKTVCVVGKGLTFDSGGISIKPPRRWTRCAWTCAGPASVLGLFHALKNGGLDGAAQRTRIVGLAVCAENMPDANAQRPGDVVTAMDGTTIEVLNTDAEGRLVLADALCYAKRTFEPAQMIDLATLTGP
jgi:leucyl aminopeptidase